MFSHYMTTALRNFWRHWIATGLNVLGLTLGLMCAIGSLNLIHFFKLDDSQYADTGHTYLVSQQYVLSGDTAFPILYRTAPYTVADSLKAALPSVDAARVKPADVLRHE